MLVWVIQMRDWQPLWPNRGRRAYPRINSARSMFQIISSNFNDPNLYLSNKLMYLRNLVRYPFLPNGPLKFTLTGILLQFANK